MCSHLGLWAGLSVSETGEGAAACMSNKRGLLLATTFEDVEVKRAEKKYLKKKIQVQASGMSLVYLLLPDFLFAIYLFT